MLILLERALQRVAWTTELNVPVITHDAQKLRYWKVKQSANLSQWHPVIVCGIVLCQAYMYECVCLLTEIAQVSLQYISTSSRVA